MLSNRNSKNKDSKMSIPQNSDLKLVDKNNILRSSREHNYPDPASELQSIRQSLDRA